MGTRVMKASNLGIGALSRKTSLSIHAIRFYEKEGLLSRPARSEGGFRRYGPGTVERLLFIRKAKEFGLTLSEIKSVTRCGSKGLGPCCAMAVKLFTRKERELGARIKDLNRTKRKVRGLLSGCINNKKRPRRGRE
jgi:MerR family mercuric resistance operon transcriptional regulator